MHETLNQESIKECGKVGRQMKEKAKSKASEELELPFLVLKIEVGHEPRNVSSIERLKMNSRCYLARDQ